MQNEIISLLLYPIQSLKLNEHDIEDILQILKNEFRNLSKEELMNLFETKLENKDVKRISGNISDKDKLKYFKISKTIVESVDLSKEQIERLSEIGKVLKINAMDTDFEYDIYNLDEINDFEFKKTVRNFSLVSAAIGFIPFIPISDFVILSVIQIGMITKISNVYKFKLEPRGFLKMISGTLGIGFLLKYMSKLLNMIIPFLGWAINASVAYAGTYAIGIITKSYIEENGELTKDSIKSIWEKSFKEGKEDFWELKDYIYKKKDELLKEFDKIKKNSKESYYEDTESVDIKDIKKQKKSNKNKRNK